MTFPPLRLPRPEPGEVRIVEVGPRDGLQNEPETLPTEVKVEFIRLLAESGLRQIECTSFVHPKWIPQLADAGHVIAHLPRRPGLTFSALVPNLKGLDRAMEAGVRRIAVFTAASETFTHKNINMSIADSLKAFEQVITHAIAHHVSVRAYISTAFVCPFEGEIFPARVLDVASELVQMGADEVAISDTVGAAGPNHVAALLDLLLQHIPLEQVALHFHDTYGMALANTYVSLLAGVRTFDGAAGGLGGCPYAPGASGNVSTEDLVNFMHALGMETGVNVPKLVEAAAYMQRVLGRPLPSRHLRRTPPVKASATG